MPLGLASTEGLGLAAPRVTLAPSFAKVRRCLLAAALLSRAVPAFELQPWTNGLET